MLSQSILAEDHHSRIAKNIIKEVIDARNVALGSHCAALGQILGRIIIRSSSLLKTVSDLFILIVARLQLEDERLSQAQPASTTVDRKAIITYRPRHQFPQRDSSNAHEC